MSTSRPALTEPAGSDEAAGREQSPRPYHLLSTMRNRLSSSVAPTTRVVLSNAASLVGTYVVTSVLGLGFWLLAARHYSKGAVGLTGGLVSAMALVGGIATLGFGTMLVGELPRRRDARRALVTSAMTVAAFAGVVGWASLCGGRTAGELGVPPAHQDELPWPRVRHRRGPDLGRKGLRRAAIGALRGGLQLWRNFFFAAAKLAAIAVFAFSALRSGVWLLWAWIAGLAASMLLIVLRDSRGGPLAHPRTGRGRLSSEVFGGTQSDTRPTTSPSRSLR